MPEQNQVEIVAIPAVAPAAVPAVAPAAPAEEQHHPLNHWIEEPRGDFNMEEVLARVNVAAANRELGVLLEEAPAPANEVKQKESKQSYDQLLKKSIPKGWRLIKNGENFVYPCKMLNDNYNPVSGWRNINVLGVDKLNKPFNPRWGRYIIPIKTKKNN